DLATRETRYLTTDITADVEGFSLSDDGRHLLFNVSEAGLGRLYLMDLADFSYRLVEGVPVGVIGTIAWHKDNRHVAISVNSARSPSDLHVLDIKTGEITRWTQSELGGVVSETLSEPELIRWKSFDDLEISGFLYRPPE